MSLSHCDTGHRVPEEEEAGQLWLQLSSMRPEMTKDCAERRQAVKAFTVAVCSAAKASAYEQLVDKEVAVKVKPSPKDLLQRASSLATEVRSFCARARTLMAEATSKQEETAAKVAEMLRERCEETEEVTPLVCVP